MIGAVVLWLITFCVSIFFAYPVIAKGTVIDFAKQDAMDRKKVSRQIARERKSHSATLATRSPTAVLGQSFSYDSQVDWTTPIPRRTNNARVSSVQPTLSRPPATIDAPQQRATTRKESSITVDDVSQQNEMEVYISKRLERIQQLAEV